MEELRKPTLMGDKIEIVDQKQFEKQKRLFSSTVKHRGHTMYEINCSSGEIRDATYKEERVEFVQEYCLITNAPKGLVPKIVKDIDCKENCLYIAALNKKTAKKKYLKYLLENMRLK